MPRKSRKQMVGKWIENYESREREIRCRWLLAQLRRSWWQAQQEQAWAD